MQTKKEADLCMLKLTNLKKTYTVGDFVTNAVDGISIEFRQQEFVAILGPSGCGKTTLLNIIGALDRPDSGEISLYGNSLNEFSSKDLDMYRNHSLGFIFQTHNLVPHLSIVENVEMGMTLAGVGPKERRERALELLEQVGLIDHINKKPNQLSVGQSQRIAIARALANDPDIILADEPTGSVDSTTSIQIMNLLKEVAKDKLVIMVTHDTELADQYATRIIRLNDGHVIEDTNPYDSGEGDKVTKDLILNKTAMSFATSFLGALKNLKTKLGRTFLTAFASSIGIIGIALILALSQGMNREIDNFQRDTLGNYPLKVSYQYTNFEKIMDYRPDDLPTKPDIQEVIPYEPPSISGLMERNDITEDYVNYVKDYYNGEGKDNISALTIKYFMEYTILNKKEDADGTITYNKFYNENKTPPTMPLPVSNSSATLLPDGDMFDTVYDIVAGTRPVHDPANKIFEVYLTVDEYNRIEMDILKGLGFDPELGKNIPYSEFIGRSLYLYPGTYDENNFDVNEAIELRISGIVRLKVPEGFTLFVKGIGYDSDLINYLRENHNDIFGVVDYIHIFPENFKQKDEVKAHLDLYNETNKDILDKPIVYVDDSILFSRLSKNIIDSISIVLIALTSVSLVVSSIMIAIITYTSVIERTKEIGLMRALGARKKDVSRTFNSENLIIGFASGVFGMLITFILTFPLNIIVHHYANVKNISQVSFIHVIALVAISTFLAFIAGLIPSRMAANKDPVDALRVE